MRLTRRTLLTRAGVAAGSVGAPRNPACGIFGVGFALDGYTHIWDAIDGDLGNDLRELSEGIGFHGFYPDMKKESGDQAWPLLETYVGQLA